MCRHRVFIKGEFMEGKLKIIIVDDDKLVAMSLKTILEMDTDIEVMDIGSDGTEAIELFEKHHPDVLLMDIQMKEMSGLDAAEIILKKNPTARILLLTTFLDDEYIVKALQVGTKGYILKQDFEGIIPALKAVCRGQNVFGNEIIHKIPGFIHKKEQFDYGRYSISDKEKEIISEVANGFSNKEIAERLFLSEGTVRNYISTILEKLALRDRTQLAVFYYQNMK